MEHDLCEAAITGDTKSLHNIIGKDPLILHKVAAGCFHGAASPLHVATSNNQTHFVKELLNLKPELAEVLDLQLRSALHLASAQGHAEIVKVMLEKGGLEMCLVRDRDGKNPLHIAAMKGKISALEELVRNCPEAARVRVDQNETILHLCVKHKQLESLKKLLEMIKGYDFVNAKDNGGNTILHLAILYKHFEMAGHVLEMKTAEGKETIDHVNATNGCCTTIRKTLQNVTLQNVTLEKIAHLLGKGTNEEKETIDVNATNASGHTAMDILFLGSGNEKEKERDGHTAMDILFLGSGNEKEKKRDGVRDLLLNANAKQAKDLVGGDWLTNRRESLMVVASLIAAMAFQAVVSPPGGVWQENSPPRVNFNETSNKNETIAYRAGEAVMAYNYPDSYPVFLRCNTIGFVASLSTILLLMSGLKFRNKATMWVLIVTMWLAITSMAITYSFSNVVVTPKKDRGSLTNTIKIGVIVWSSVMGLLLAKHTFSLVTFFAIDKRSKRNANKRLEEKLGFRGGKGRGANPPLPVRS